MSLKCYCGGDMERASWDGFSISTSMKCVKCGRMESLTHCAIRNVFSIQQLPDGVKVIYNKYAWQPDMAEISGLGGNYEAACRDMLCAGLEWLDAHPNANPQFGRRTSEDNADAQALSAAVTSAPLVSTPETSCTGAMHHAVINACLWIRKHSWDEYVTEMTK